jgi:hypothetical protein
MGFGFSEDVPLELGKWRVDYKKRTGFELDLESPDGFKH